MAKSLIERIRAARQQRVESGDMTFTVRRPNDLEWSSMKSSGSISHSDLLQCVCGWGEVTEIDLGIAGGTGEKVPFDHAIYMEWIADHPEHWEKISNAVIDSYKKHDEEVSERVKNLLPGS